MTHQCDICQTKFEANLVDKIPSQTEITPSLKVHFEKSFFKCICHNCLIQFQKLDDMAQKYPFPQQPNAYIQGVHYYIEGGYWVFSTLYHYQKGYCCKNGCRHCAYGYKK